MFTFGFPREKKSTLFYRKESGLNFVRGVNLRMSHAWIASICNRALVYRKQTPALSPTGSSLTRDSKASMLASTPADNKSTLHVISYPDEIACHVWVDLHGHKRRVCEDAICFVPHLLRGSQLFYHICKFVSNNWKRFHSACKSFLISSSQTGWILLYIRFFFLFF